MTMLCGARARSTLLGGMGGGAGAWLPCTHDQHPAGFLLQHPNVGALIAPRWGALHIDSPSKGPSSCWYASPDRFEMQSVGGLLVMADCSRRPVSFSLFLLSLWLVSRSCGQGAPDQALTRVNPIVDPRAARRGEARWASSAQKVKPTNPSPLPCPEPVSASVASARCSSSTPAPSSPPPPWLLPSSPPLLAAGGAPPWLPPQRWPNTAPPAAPPHCPPATGGCPPPPPRAWPSP